MVLEHVGARPRCRNRRRGGRVTSSAAVICTWSMKLRFQTGSKMLLAKRNTSRFCTVSLPR